MSDPTEQYVDEDRPVVEADPDPEAPADAPPDDVLFDEERDAEPDPEGDAPVEAEESLAEENAATSLDQPSDNVE